MYHAMGHQVQCLQGPGGHRRGCTRIGPARPKLGETAQCCKEILKDILKEILQEILEENQAEQLKIQVPVHNDVRVQLKDTSDTTMIKEVGRWLFVNPEFCPSPPNLIYNNACDPKSSSLS